jgi:hypothetical protein
MPVQPPTANIKKAQPIPQTMLFSLIALPSSLWSHQMSLLRIIVSLASLFLFAGFAAAGVYGTGCTTSALDWVCVMYIRWQLSDLLVLHSDVQQSSPKWVCSRSVPDFNLQRWL